MQSNFKYHEPVLLAEMLDFVNIGRLAHLHGTKVIDATLGFGGHTIEILKRGVEVLGIEADSETLKLAKNEIDNVFLRHDESDYGGSKTCPASENKFGSFKLIHSNFKDIDIVARENGFGTVDGVLFDLGVSTYQIKSDSRGFSFSNPDAYLDMRLDRSTQGVRASMLLNALDQTQLVNMFGKVLDFGLSKRLAKAVVEARKVKAFETVGDLLKLTDRIFTKSANINPATKAFMALRIAVNSELENLSEALPKAFSLLNKGGRLVVISFHSGEDSIVKAFMKKAVNERIAAQITSKPVAPKSSEIKMNPKSRSAKLRCIEKI